MSRLDDRLLADVTALLRARDGSDRVALIGIDGLAGSGKTTFAAALAAHLDAVVVHLDDLYDGWSGLAAGIGLARHQVQLPLRPGSSLELPRFDWSSGTYAAPTHVVVNHALVLEGVGACAAELRPYLDVLIYLDAPEATRRTRALSRGGEDFEAHWDDWARQESQYLATDRPREYADIVYDTESGRWNVRI